MNGLLAAVGRYGALAGIGGTAGAAIGAVGGAFNGQDQMPMLHGAIMGGLSGFETGAGIGAALGITPGMSKGIFRGFRSATPEATSRAYSALREDPSGTMKGTALNAQARVLTAFDNAQMPSSVADGMTGLGRGLLSASEKIGYAAGAGTRHAFNSVRGGVKAAYRRPDTYVTPDSNRGPIAQAMKPVTKASLGLGTGAVMAGTVLGPAAVIGTAAMSGEGHPFNATSKFLGGSGRMQRQAAAESQIEAIQANQVAMSNPYQVGLRDLDDFSMYSASNKQYLTSPQRVRSQGRRSQRISRITPGRYGDDGNLVFALNELRTA